MKILLIGNFAPPYEEENLHNISLLYMLEKDGHNCTVINISENPSPDKRFIDAKSVAEFMFKLLRHCRKKDIIHFSTKGYLRVGLLKLMASVFAGKLFRSGTVITFHSELFSMLGQMRSPFGGTQTLHTSFSMVDKSIFHDRDTYEVASMYRKKSNFELIPSFIHVPDEIRDTASRALEKLADRKRFLVFSNVLYPSFLFDVIIELANNYSVPDDTGIVISFSEKSSSKLQRVIEDTAPSMKDNTVFIEPDNIKALLSVYSRADVLVRALSCDGMKFFEDFSLSVKKVYHSDDNVYFPGGFVIVKEGKTADMCLKTIITLLSADAEPPHELESGDPYTRIKLLYEDL